jgi:hypothetical protein
MIKIYVEMFPRGVNVSVEVTLVSALIVPVAGGKTGTGIPFVADNSPINFG